MALDSCWKITLRVLRLSDACRSEMDGVECELEENSQIMVDATFQNEIGTVSRCVVTIFIDKFLASGSSTLQVTSGMGLARALRRSRGLARRIWKFSRKLPLPRHR